MGTIEFVVVGFIIAIIVSIIRAKYAKKEKYRTNKPFALPSIHRVLDTSHFSHEAVRDKKTCILISSENNGQYNPSALIRVAQECQNRGIGHRILFAFVINSRNKVNIHNLSDDPEMIQTNQLCVTLENILNNGVILDKHFYSGSMVATRRDTNQKVDIKEYGTAYILLVNSMMGCDRTDEAALYIIPEESIFIGDTVVVKSYDNERTIIERIIRSME